MHFKMSSAIYFNLEQSKILSSGNGLIQKSRLKASIFHYAQKFHNIHVILEVFNLLPDLPILDSSSSTANIDMMSKI